MENVKRSKSLKRINRFFTIAIIILLTILFTTIAVVIISGEIEKYYYKNSIDSYNKLYTQVYVEKDDTVSNIYDNIVEKYTDTSNINKEDFISEVGFINNLNSDYEIKYGTKIIVPYLNGLKEVTE